MKHSEKMMPVAAALTALSTLACCLPLGVSSALGAAGLAVVLAPARGWLLGISVAFLALGLFQLYRTKGVCQRPSRGSVAVFWIAAIIVAVVTLLPQALAGFLADRLP